ncbi:MAG: CBS domain-containing protein [Rhodospirillaceae bacterium]
MDYSAATSTTLTVKRFLEQYGHSALTMRSSDTIVTAADLFHSTVDGKKYSMAVVLDGDDSVAGVLSLGDIVYALYQHKEAIFSLTVSDIMTRNIKVARLGDDILALLKTMADHDIRHMPVVENGKLAGLVTRKDALEGLYDNATLELKSLTQFVFRSDARY